MALLAPLVVAATFAAPALAFSGAALPMSNAVPATSLRRPVGISMPFPGSVALRGVSHSLVMPPLEAVKPRKDGRKAHVGPEPRAWRAGGVKISKEQPPEKPAYHMVTEDKGDVERQWTRRVKGSVWKQMARRYAPKRRDYLAYREGKTAYNFDNVTNPYIPLKAMADLRASLNTRANRAAKAGGDASSAASIDSVNNNGTIQSVGAAAALSALIGLFAASRRRQPAMTVAPLLG